MRVSIDTWLSRVVTCAACDFTTQAWDNEQDEIENAYDRMLLHEERCDTEALMEHRDGAIHFWVEDAYDVVSELGEPDRFPVSRTGPCYLDTWSVRALGLEDFEDEDWE